MPPAEFKEAYCQPRVRLQRTDSNPEVTLRGIASTSQAGRSFYLVQSSDYVRWFVDQSHGVRQAESLKHITIVTPDDVISLRGRWRFLNVAATVSTSTRKTSRVQAISRCWRGDRALRAAPGPHGSFHTRASRTVRPNATATFVRTGCAGASPGSGKEAGREAE